MLRLFEPESKGPASVYVVFWGNRELDALRTRLKTGSGLMNAPGENPWIPASCHPAEWLMPFTRCRFQATGPDANPPTRAGKRLLQPDALTVAVNNRVGLQVNTNIY
jgi:hypothetical protein